MITSLKRKRFEKVLEKPQTQIWVYICALVVAFSAYLLWVLLLERPDATINTVYFTLGTGILVICNTIGLIHNIRKYYKG